MAKQWIQSRERQLKGQKVEKERKEVSMHKLRTIFAVLVMALTIAALGVVPIQSTAQTNSYDDSFDAIARRHGYYRAFMAATTTGAAITTQDGFDLARGAAADTARWVAMGEFYSGLNSLSEVGCQGEGC